MFESCISDHFLIKEIAMSHLEEIIQSSLWRPPSVDDEPRTLLSQWQAYEVKKPDGSGWDLHFYGNTGREGRVCSAVQSYDKESHCGITRSGRIYELSGYSGYNSDALYVWNNWLAIYKNPEIRCVTEQYEYLV
jgi:hypothetical protein